MRLREFAQAEPMMRRMASGAGRAAGRILPGVGTALSAKEAAERWQRGDRTGAVISTLAALGWLVPGPLGWTLGGGLEAANLARDLDEAGTVATQARTRNLMARLRAQYPQARSDAEALLLHFDHEQRKDQREIDRLDYENDQEEADIDRIDQEVSRLKHRRGTGEAINPALSFESALNKETHQ